MYEFGARLHDTRVYLFVRSWLDTVISLRAFRGNTLKKLPRYLAFKMSALCDEGIVRGCMANSWFCSIELKLQLLVLRESKPVVNNSD